MPSVPLLVKDKYCPAGYTPLTIDHSTGIRRYFKDLDGKGKVHLIAVQPTDEIVAQNEREQYDAKGTFTKRGKWGVLAARVPVMQLEQWRRHECGDLLDDDDFAKVKKRNLNSNEFQKFRVAEFKL